MFSIKETGKWSMGGCGQGERTGKDYDVMSGEKVVGSFSTENSYPSSSSDRDHGPSGSSSYRITRDWPGWTQQDYQEMDAIISRNQSLMQGFTGQVLGGSWGNDRHCRDYKEKPTVNKEMLAAARQSVRENNPKAVNFVLFHKHYLNDDDMYWLSSIFNTHTPKGLAVNTVDLSNNCLTLVRDSNLGYVDLPFFSFNSPYNTPRNILRLDLSNNQIGDAGAKVVADGLANGVFPITKCINLAGNKITKDGFKSFLAGLENPKVKSIMITLEQNIVDINNTMKKAAKSTVDFITKGLKYAVDEHNKDMKGTKWDGTTVRTDSMDKWKNCKEVGQNVEMGFFGGLLKCSPLVETGPGMFICAGAQASLALLDPDTAWCIVEIKEFVDEKEIMGDCAIF